MPLLLMVRNFTAFKVALVIFLIAAVGVYLFWYKALLPIQKEVEEKFRTYDTVNDQRV